MKILIAPDKFKDALSAIEVCDAIEKGIRIFNPEIEVKKIPLADGGEGTMEILVYHTGGKKVRLWVHDPLFRPIKAVYGLSADGKTAFIEMASASGLDLLRPGERNCLHTTSLGTGEMILDAVHKGVEHIILGIGGSATSDGGIGMATALNYEFLDENANLLKPVGESLPGIARIRQDNLFVQPGRIKVEVACDVKNPLYGPDGAAYVYGPQKGADPAAVELLDRGLQNLAAIWAREGMPHLAQIPGAGAAGGMGAGTMAFLGATLRSGIDLVMEQTAFEDQLSDVDLIITGEGKIDNQTLFGKTIYGVCKRAKTRQIPVVALCGSLEANTKTLDELGLLFAASIINKPISLADALVNTAEGLSFSTYQLLKLFSVRTLD